MNTSMRTLDRKFQQFKLSRTGLPNGVKLADYVLLAEFDIDTGSTLRHKYPSSVPGYRDDWFPDYMLPEGAHNHQLDWTVIFLNKQSKKSALSDEGDEEYANCTDCESENTITMESAESTDTLPFLYCINLVRKKSDIQVPRGAVVKAMAVCSQHHFIEMFRPLLIIALDRYYQSNSLSVLADLYNTINTADVSTLPRPYAWERRLMVRGVAGRPIGGYALDHLPHNWTHIMSFEFGEKKVQTAVRLYSTPDETLNPSVTLLFIVFGPGAMKIYNAILTGLRILFVGYNHSAGEVGRHVLAACAMVAPPFRGIIRRTFPYANLSDLSFMETPGYIAGVTNPVFEAQTSHWDMLCQLDMACGTGIVFTADEKILADEQKGKRTPPRPPNRKMIKSDSLICEEDIPFAARLIAGISAGMSEQWVRSMLRDYTQSLIDLTVDQDADICPTLSPPLKKDTWGDSSQSFGPPSPQSISVNKAVPSSILRLQEMKKLPDFPGAQAKNPWINIQLGEGISGCQLRGHIRRLHMASSSSCPLDDQEVLDIFRDFDVGLQSESSLQVLLGILPESQGGIFILGCGLFHRNPQTRNHARRLHQRLSQFDSTRPALQASNKFFAMALSQLSWYNA